MDILTLEEFIESMATHTCIYCAVKPVGGCKKCYEMYLISTGSDSDE